MATLILVRHGQSTWNASNRFTGWVDVPLNHVGREQAIAAAQKISVYPVKVAFTSLLMRAMETAAICLTEGGGVLSGKSPVFKHDADDPDWHGWDLYDGDHSQEIPIFPVQALDERNYGQLQGFNKEEMALKVGAEKVHQWRRSYSTRPPGGESLEDTVARTVPFFRDRILTHLMAGESVLVAAHGNSLRAVIMHLDQLTPDQVVNLELATGVPIVYEIDPQGNVTDKTILT
ncbi:2,3-bisphosphoglycerate-dependent phosphoglycerate mutase [Oscillatoria sp. FACHB-1407]|uniref:2,3-bisphosphoglycerate-dependent phosphoglycerate mutase n=1 Tax=Oscillatoria sp. FACHB-1407 TaxID=2692847 RepID=UPI001688A5D8|nr:2,3-bisphosphoglycerate-dependent phosphoglycerate mutase [Oscillatoria sp. FACHB-1407]MBD2459618.1 2,3-bisphosphoglycerate-dependent phosphoglycerate mutase [Oscillatoria sp. FACHB-1407]